MNEEIEVSELLSIIGNWLKRNKKIVLITFGIILSVLAIVMFFVKVIELPIKEGRVVERTYDEEHVAYLEDRKSVKRTEVYTTTNSKGNIVVRIRQVHDYYMYCVDKHLDREDYIVRIEQPSKKHEGKILGRYIYVSKEIYDKLEIKDYFVADFKERKESTRDKNNSISQVTDWSRLHVNMEPWLTKQY